jgi:hypothetical protein
VAWGSCSPRHGSACGVRSNREAGNSEPHSTAPPFAFADDAWFRRRGADRSDFPAFLASPACSRCLFRVVCRSSRSLLRARFPRRLGSEDEDLLEKFYDTSVYAYCLYVAHGKPADFVLGDLDDEYITKCKTLERYRSDKLYSHSSVLSHSIEKIYDYIAFKKANFALKTYDELSQKKYDEIDAIKKEILELGLSKKIMDKIIEIIDVPLEKYECSWFTVLKTRNNEGGTLILKGEAVFNLIESDGYLIIDPNKHNETELEDPYGFDFSFLDNFLNIHRNQKIS